MWYLIVSIPDVCPLSYFHVLFWRLFECSIVLNLHYNMYFSSYLSVIDMTVVFTVHIHLVEPSHARIQKILSVGPDVFFLLAFY